MVQQGPLFRAISLTINLHVMQCTIAEKSRKSKLWAVVFLMISQAVAPSKRQYYRSWSGVSRLLLEAR